MEKKNTFLDDARQLGEAEAPKYKVLGEAIRVGNGKASPDGHRIYSYEEVLKLSGVKQ